MRSRWLHSLIPNTLPVELGTTVETLLGVDNPALVALEAVSLSIFHRDHH